MRDATATQALAGTGDSLSGTIAGRFLIRGLLGTGGMGEVYRADDTRLKRTVALKRLAPQLRANQVYRQRFLKEAERASGLTGEHVAAIYDVLDEQGEIFLIMEFVEGETLREQLRILVLEHRKPPNTQAYEERVSELEDRVAEMLEELQKNEKKK